MDSVDLEQGTKEWKESKLGYTSASRIHDVLSKPRKRGQEESSGRRNYKAKLIFEILSGKESKEDGVETWWTRRGEELEPDGRSEYELRNKVAVQTCGFIKHPSIPRYGCSPDGLVGDDGIIQIKCLNRANHLECLTSGIPTQYAAQMVCELSVTGRQWNDFVSYHPEAPDDLKLYVKRIWRKDVLHIIESMEAEVIKFTREIDETIASITKPKSLEAQLEASLNR